MKRKPDEREKAREVSRDNWNRRMSVLESVATNAEKKKLHGRDRLHAAAYVRKLFEKARNMGYQRQEIQNRVGAYVKRGGFKIDKWMIDRQIETVDEHVEKLFEGRSEPQKKLSTYLAIVEVISGLLDEDSQVHKVRLLEPTRLWETAWNLGDDMRRSNMDIEPHQRLADLLHSCARSAAKRCDLARIWVAADQHDLCWVPSSGPKAFVCSQSEPEDVRFRRDLVPMDDLWEFYDELPPYPSVDIAQVPFSSVNLEVCIDQSGAQSQYGSLIVHERDLPEFEDGDWIDARLIGYWNLALSICPVNGFGDVGAALLQYPCYYLALPSEDHILEKLHRTNLYNSNSAFLKSHGYDSVLIDGEWRRAKRKREGEGKGRTEQICRLSDPHLSDYMWQESIFQAARYHPVDPRLVAALEPVPYCVELAPSGTANTIACVGDSFYQEETLPTIWYTPPFGLLRNIELALLNGEIESGLIRWAEDYLKSLDEFEQKWRDRGIAAERELRARWHEAEVSFARGLKKKRDNNKI